MKPLRIFIVVLVLALVGVAIWVAGQSRKQGVAPDTAAVAPVAYDYEAHDVIVQQMGTDGRLQYQIDAREIHQEPDSGQIVARDLTLFHDPPGTEAGSPSRWTLTADSGVLPAGDGVVTLAGKVRANGRPQQGKATLTLATERLRYDVARQEITSDTSVALTWGGNRLNGSALRANIRTGSIALESEIHGTFSP
ncbi:MAG: LPS export ABC transporter periplasmic protein LptC [Steroidobacteraceae bacterium]